MRIVIVGGGFGGVYAAQKFLSCRLPRRRWDLLLVNRNPRFEFKPLFPEVFAGRLPPELARFPLENLFTKQQCQIKIAEVVGIEPEKRLVKTDKGDVTFDYLVIALGGVPELVPTTTGAELFTFESLDDCLRLCNRFSELVARAKRSRKRKGRDTIAVIGAGSTGVEVACEMSHMLGERLGDGERVLGRTPLDILLLEASPEILPGWRPELRKQAKDVLKRTHIRLLTGTRVSRVGRGRVYLKGRRSFGAEIIIWTGGLRGLPLYQAFGIPLDEKGRLRVNSKLQIPLYKNVYAMGDAINSEAFAMPVPQSAQAAYQQADLVVSNIEHGVVGKPAREFQYLELGQALPVGGRRAIGRILGVPVEGRAAWALEKALFLLRIPGIGNKLRLLDGLAVEPLVKKGIEYLEKGRSP